MESSDVITFNDFGLDDRILKAIAELGWKHPTPIQEKAIPLALEGKDIFARARTGSGKTALFLVPILQRLLERRQTKRRLSVCALILAPTKELAKQIFGNIQELCQCCSRDIVSLDISALSPTVAKTTVGSLDPNIVIGTPSRVLSVMQAGGFPTLKSTLEFLVIDEADLLFSFGYSDDTKEVLKNLSAVYQSFLTSATLSDDVKFLKRLVQHNPVMLNLEETQLPTAAQLTQYYIKCTEEDRFTLIYALLKLKLVRGKTIIFVNSVERSYRLKLYLGQFGISSCVLNSDLPVNSRCHIVQEFNNGMYRFVIASDENQMITDQSQSTQAPTQPSTSNTTDGGKEREGQESGNKGASGGQNSNKDTKKKGKHQDRESGIARGIDFHNVSNVLNFDFPPNFDSYVHRIGRTARGWNKGTALSFACGNAELKLLRKTEKRLVQHLGDGVLKPYEFDLDELVGFRYRATDAFRAVTATTVLEARLEEIKREILTSKRLGIASLRLINLYSFISSRRWCS